MASTTTHVVPAISSGTAGPLGAIHLPRLWEKLTLAAAGLLPNDYDECGAGFDQMTLDALKLDKQNDGIHPFPETEVHGVRSVGAGTTRR